MLQRKDDPEFFMFCCIGKCPVCKQHFQVIVFCFLLYDMERNAIVKVKTDQLLGFEILCFAFAVILQQGQKNNPLLLRHVQALCSPSVFLINDY